MKLVAKGRSGQDQVKWELYDIEADRSELNDLASREPGRLNKMAALWQAYAERAQVLPWPSSGRKTAKK